MRLRRRFPAALLLAFAVAYSIPSAAEPSVRAEPIDVETRPIASFRVLQPDERRFGALEFLGGLEIVSRDRNLGGLSGLVVAEDGGSLVAITDNGLWFTATLQQDVDGRPLSLKDAVIAPMIGPDGRALIDRSGADSEALTLRRGPDGEEFLVTLEGRHRVYAFPAPFDPNARGRRIAMPEAVERLRRNKGLEAFAAAPEVGPLAGSLIGIAEQGRTVVDDMPGFIVGGDFPGSFTVRRRDDFDATDLAFLPDGDLLLLERRFNLRHGIGFRLRQLRAADIRPGALVDGTVLITAGFGEQIDNMEGLAVHRGADGFPVLSLLSDDNRSILQRTLLLRFRLLGEDNVFGKGPELRPSSEPR